MRVLVTNDDGIGSTGILVLARAALDIGLDVVVAAPSDERSGSSAALVVVESDAGFRPELVRLATLPHVTAYGVPASPALIAALAYGGAFGAPPELVLSGINHGTNTGQSVLHSGTVGAGFTAVARGIPAIAFSSAGTGRDAWSTARVVARHVVSWAAGQNDLPQVVLNVNIPDCDPAALRGLRSAHLAAFGAAQAQVETPQQKSIITFSEPSDVPLPDTDDALLAKGWATITPVMAPCETTVALPGLLTARLVDLRERSASA